MVVVIIFEEDDEDVDDGEDPFPNAFVAFRLLPPFAFPFRPEEDRVYFKEKNVGEEEAESKALIVEKSSKSSKESCCSSFARECSDEAPKALAPSRGKLLLQKHRKNRRV